VRESAGKRRRICSTLANSGIDAPQAPTGCSIDIDTIVNTCGEANGREHPAGEPGT